MNSKKGLTKSCLLYPFKYIPLANPFRRIAKLTEIYYQEAVISASVKLKILSYIAKETKELEAFGRFPQDNITQSNFS